MSTHGTVLLARSSRLLVELPSVRSAFGTFWHSLSRRDDGWQLLRIDPPFPHQWPTVGAGPGPIAAETSAPVLAVWTAGSTCATFGAALPGGASWSGHFPDCRGEADHQEEATLRLPGPLHTTPQELVSCLLGWAREAELPLPGSALAAAFDGRRPIGEAILDLVEMFGFTGPRARVVPPLFDHTEPEWMGVWYQGWRASAQIGGEWSWRLTGLDTSRDPMRLTEEGESMIRFVERVAASMYGGGLSRAELAAEAARLEAVREPS